MELFDVVDENGLPTGETVERSAAHRDGIRHRTAHVWLIRRTAGGRQVLLQKRAAGKDSFPGCFDTSSAGHIQAGDEPTESALRELHEELGVTAGADELSFAGCFRISYEKEFRGKLFRDNEISFVYVLEKDLPEAAFTLQEEEVESVVWMDPDELRLHLEPRDPAFCVPMGGFRILDSWCAAHK